VGPPEAAKPKRFHGNVSLNPIRVGLDASRLADEVIAHLTALPNATAVLKVLLSCHALSPGPIPTRTIVEMRQSDTGFASRKPASECPKRVFTVEVTRKHRDESRQLPWAGL
jgi:hypothetical protein